MCTLKAIRCWLKAKPTDLAPKGWIKKREKINDRIEKFEKISNYEATIEEIDDEENIEQKREEGSCKPEIVKNRGRLDMESRHQNAYKALEYNILRKDDNEELQRWKSYPGISKIVKIARNIIENDDKEDIDILVDMMKVHESQQSAAVVSTIAILVGSKLRNEVKKEIREAVGDIILWDVPVIKEKDDWPQRKKFSTKIVYENDDEEDCTWVFR